MSTPEQLLEAFINTAEETNLLSQQDTREILLAIMKDDAQPVRVREAAKELRFLLLKDQS